MMAGDARNLYRIPDSMTYEEAALLEPLSVGIWGCHRAGLKPGDDVLVTGAGPVGLLAGAVAKALGAASVTIIDPSQFRLGVARGMGLLTDFDAAGADRFDVCMECSGARGVRADGLRRLRPWGRAACSGCRIRSSLGSPCPSSTSMSSR